MSQRIHRWTARAAVAMVVCILAATQADALIVVTPKPDQPNNNRALQLTKQTVHVDMTDRAAEVNVEFTYHNSSRWVLEGTYLFPLPPEAAVDNFSLFVDGEEIDAELLDVDEARRTYQSIVRRIKDPALLEYVDRQLLKARIFPINPNEDAKIKLYYTHPLIADFGTTDFVFPFSIEQRAPNADISLTADIKTTSPLKAVTSPTHDMNVDIDGLYRATASSPADWQASNSDFHLLCTYDTRDLGAQFLTTVDADGDRYFMGIIAPGEAAQGTILPKDVVFCFDRSGSMQGEKIEQARNALEFCLGRLNDDDRFGLIVFNDGIDMYAPELRSASSSEIKDARDFVGRVSADGGTFIDGALQRSLELFTKGDRPKYLVFLTDGLPTVGTRDPKTILNNAKDRNDHDARVFTFGVGHDLNAGLLNDLADGGHGIASYVEPGEDVEVKVSNFFRKISRPVLTNCGLEFGGDVRVSEIYPRELPDVYAGSEIMVVGRFEGTGVLKAKLTGLRGTESINHDFTSEFHPRKDRYAFIPKLWAGRRIGYLLEDMRQHGETQEVKDEVIRLSKKYGIMTPYTAYLAAPEEVRIASMRDRPATSVADILRSQVGVDVRNDQFHVRGGQSSEELVERDVSEAKLKSAPSAQAFQAPKPVAGDEERMLGAGAVPSVSVGGKQFTFMNGYWTDWELVGNASPPADTIAVMPFSEAYFTLSQNPEIARILPVGNPLILLWHNVVIRIDKNGVESWNSAWDKSL
jgi:Ca-activated chloride channel family protein